MNSTPPTSTLFPYTTLFRSIQRHRGNRGNKVKTYHKGMETLRPRRKVTSLMGIHSSVWRRWPRRSEEHTSELQSRQYLVCRLLLEKKKKKKKKKSQEQTKKR